MPRLKVLKGKYVFFIISITLLIGLHLAVKWVKRVGYLPIEVVTLSDKLQYADPQQIKDAVKPYLSAGFFGLEVGRIRNELQTVPWIADANVQRCWPDTVKIKIYERHPLAVWQGKGIIDTEGKLFFPNNVAAMHELPQFSGAQSSVDAMVDMYLLLLSTLKPIGLAVKQLDLSTEQGWRVLLDNDITIMLGHTELEERLTRFVWAYGTLQTGADGLQKIKVVDLRYTNGLSVG